MSSLFIVDDKQHMPVCTKTISSWVRKVLGIAKAQKSLQGAVPSAGLVAGVSLVFIPQIGDWSKISTPARCYPVAFFPLGPTC